MLRVAVDFGTSSTCTVVSVDGREPQVVVVDGAPLVPSSIYATPDGTLFVGHEADRQAAVAPSRYEPHPKRRIDEGELLLGDTVLPVIDVIRAVLARAVREARHLAAGVAVDQLALTHPADWGVARTRKLRQAANGLANEIVLLPEPVAAAVFHSTSHTVPAGGALAVLDLGGGTVDASVVRREPGSSFRVLATRGDPTFGGADIDQALLEHVGNQVTGEDQDAWRRLVEGRELSDRRRRRVLRQDVRGAKETLSRHTYTDVPMPPPFPDAHVTRAALEELIAAPMTRTVALLADAVRDAGLRPEQLAGVFLVGGSSRIPLVSRLLHELLGVVPVTLDQPETVVARGALRAVLAGQVRTATPPRGAAPVPGPQRPSSAPSPAAAPVPPGHRPVPAMHPVAAGAPPRTVLPPRLHERMKVQVAGMIVGGLVLAVVAGVAAARTAGQREDDPGQRLAEFNYELNLPDGWERSGRDASERVIDLTPTGEQDPPDRIIVRESELTYDASEDRGRAVRELRQQYDDQRAGTDPSAFSGFQETASFAGREVLYYSERVAVGVVDWYVLFNGRYQVSIGCQHDESGRERVREACVRVVRSLTVTS